MKKTNPRCGAPTEWTGDMPEPRPREATEWFHAVVRRLCEEYEEGHGFRGASVYTLVIAMVIGANDRGENWSELSLLAALSGSSLQTARKGLLHLQDVGWLERSFSPGRRGAVIRQFAWPLPPLPEKSTRKRRFPQ